ncbi:MAG: hypothetical protein GY845_06720 [Planctomycetes bacterium]|nr:hypothetical protein [Planctomycetota bacterium]
MIIKEKKAVATLVRLYQLHGGGCEPTEQYQSVLAELKANPRCHFTGYKGDPSEIMAASDLIVTYAFSSSTLEALSARRKAIYFDPSNRRRGCRYDRIPNLVAHDYDELKYLVHKLLYETAEEEYSEFLNTHVKGVIDPYLDGKAVTRFRKLLSEKADTPFEQSCDLA